MGTSKVKVRRFEASASGDYGAILFLRGWGFHVSPAKNPRTWNVKPLASKGRPKVLSHSKFVDLLDQERIKAGLEPLVKR